jgi:hypothetical protein
MRATWDQGKVGTRVRPTDCGLSCARVNFQQFGGDEFITTQNNNTTAGIAKLLGVPAEELLALNQGLAPLPWPHLPAPTSLLGTSDAEPCFPIRGLPWAESHVEV